MFTTINRRAISAFRSALHFISARASQLAVALALCLMISGAVLPAIARAEPLVAAMSTHQTWVAYNSNHIPDPSGTLTNMTGLTTVEDGHVRDIYGNVLIFNTDSSISDINSIVVGYVSNESPVNPIP